MRFSKRFALVLVVVAALLSATVPVAQAQTPGGDNLALAQNTKNNSNVFDLSFNIRRVMAGAVDVDNAAVAVASCESCRTIAIAIQVVLIFSDPDVVTTDNLALALNVECTSCETMALAYQYVLTTDGPVHFTGEGNQAIAEILKEIRQIASDEELTLEEIHAQVDPLVDELYAVVDTQLVAAGPPEEQEAEDLETSTEGTPEPTTSDTTATTPAPVESSPAPDGSTTPASSESPTAAESPSSEPTPVTTP